MKKIIELLKKYKLYILLSLLVIFFFRSCSKSGQVTKLEKLNKQKTVVIDSLSLLVKNQNDSINNITEIVRQEKIKVHTEYDNWISAKDRGPQLMELHSIVKNKLKELQK